MQFLSIYGLFSYVLSIYLWTIYLCTIYLCTIYLLAIYLCWHFSLSIYAYIIYPFTIYLCGIYLLVMFYLSLYNLSSLYYLHMTVLSIYVLSIYNINRSIDVSENTETSKIYHSYFKSKIQFLFVYFSYFDIKMHFLMRITINIIEDFPNSKNFLKNIAIIWICIWSTYMLMYFKSLWPCFLLSYRIYIEKERKIWSNPNHI